MAAKYQLITELYRRTEIAVAKNPQTWQNFLAAVCRNYKCRFDEQLLIFAQRPDAVAVAQLDGNSEKCRGRSSAGLSCTAQRCDGGQFLRGTGRPEY